MALLLTRVYLFSRANNSGRLVISSSNCSGLTMPVLWCKIDDIQSGEGGIQSGTSREGISSAYLLVYRPNVARAVSTRRKGILK